MGVDGLRWVSIMGRGTKKIENRCSNFYGIQKV